ncbi:hypothetical protein WDU94_015493 [Cyamophila willieti]
MLFLNLALKLMAISGIPYPFARRLSSGYSVTIMNDSALGDFKGAVHTWLAITAPNKPTTYFSFTTGGRSSVDEDLKQRRPTEQTTLKISSWQYDQMIRSIDEFYRQRPEYSVIPTDDTTYNCVTAANRILNSAGIHLLDGFKDPVLLGFKLASIVRNFGHFV